MANFYLKSFLTLTPQENLKQYFQKWDRLPNFDWKKEFSIDVLQDAILEAPDTRIIVFDFRTINNWANDADINNLIELARSPFHKSLEIGEELGKLENEHARAMHVWIKYHDIFYWAIEMARWEHRAGKKHHFVGSGLSCEDTSNEIRKNLGGAIAEFYKKQRKGRRCEVDYYLQQNPTRHFFFANPEDNVKGYRAYDNKDKIVRQAYQPISTH